jgi:hypothetical protein
MYCIECGAQIPENSKFCSHCGKSQSEIEPSIKEQVAERIIENEIVRQVVKKHKQSLDYQFLKKAMGGYLAWIMLHLLLLLALSDGPFDGANMDGARDFWPFGRCAEFDEIAQYDITEFLVYTIFPFAILIIISLVRNQNKETSDD